MWGNFLHDFQLTISTSTHKGNKAVQMLKWHIYTNWRKIGVTELVWTTSEAHPWKRAHQTCKTKNQMHIALCFITVLYCNVQNWCIGSLITIHSCPPISHFGNFYFLFFILISKNNFSKEKTTNKDFCRKRQRI